MSAVSYITKTGAQSESVCLKHFFNASRANLWIERKPGVFLPDEWTQTFAAGLQKLAAADASFKKAAVIEIGVGTGIVMAGLMTAPRPPQSYIGVDICDEAIASATGLACAQDWNAALLKSDLLDAVADADLARTTHVIACIPQVPARVDLSVGDNSAHYYLPKGSQWDVFGLGLNAALLEQVKARTPQAGVTLNLSGRPGLPRLVSLFAQHGYDARVIHESMVAQHGGTSLESLAQMETPDCQPFEFYADEEGRETLTAAQAEQKRLDHSPVFHKVYVLSALAPSR